MLNTNIPEGDKVAGEGLNGDGLERVAAAIAGDELTGHDARQAQLLYRATMDTDARDAAGVEPARATVEAIRGLASIDDVSAFLLDTQKSAGVPTLVRPYINQASLSDDGNYVPCIDQSPQTFGSSMGTMGMDATSVSPEDELYQTRLACASAVLTRLGMSEAEAKAAFEHRVELEKRIIEDSAKAASEDGEEEADAEPAYLKPEELDGLASAFPLLRHCFHRRPGCMAKRVLRLGGRVLTKPTVDFVHSGFCPLVMLQMPTTKGRCGSTSHAIGINSEGCASSF